MGVPPKLEGSLAERDVPDLVQDLHEQRWSGLLTLTHRGIGRSISVREGRLVFASSSSPDDRLGELLLRRGRITLEQYVEVGEAVVPGKRFGMILVEQGLLSPKDLVSAVVEQTQEIIYGAFQWTEGHYRLRPGGELGSETITLKISTPNLIIEGVHRIESWARIERGVGGVEARYVRAEDYEDVLGQMTLSLEKLSLLTDLNGTKDVATICGESTLPAFEACRILWAFRIIGLIRRVDAPPSPRAQVEDEGLGAVLAPSPQGVAVSPSVSGYALLPEPPAAGKKSILVVGVAPELFDKVDPLLSRSSLAVDRVPRAEGALALCSRVGFDLVIAAYPLPDVSFETFLAALRRAGAPCAGSHLLVLADEARLAEVRASLPKGPNMALPANEPARLLEEVATRLLGVTPRVSTRLMVRLEVRFEEGKRLVMCQTENVSKAGMLVRTDRPYPVGTKMAFESQLPGVRAPIQGEAEVARHTILDAEKVQGMGLKFLGFKGDGLERLQDYLERQVASS